MAHKYGGVVEFPNYCCVSGACSNAAQGLLWCTRNLARVNLVKPVQNILGKQFGKHTFERVLN